jgi:hypothetical protein
MWKAIKGVLVALLSSKKAVMGISGAITAGIMKLGFDIPSETVGLIVAPIVASIVGQGVADAGKEAAIEKAKTPSSPTGPGNVINTVFNESVDPKPGDTK